METKELTKTIEAGLAFLEKSCAPITGFQTEMIGSNRYTLKSDYFPESVFENLVALDLLGKQLSPETSSILLRFVRPDFPLGNSSNVAIPTGIINFNKFKRLIPDDVEDTGLYHLVCLKIGLLCKQDRRLLDIVRVLILNTNINGVINLYIPPCEENRRNRLDEGSLANCLRFLYVMEVDTEYIIKSEDHLFQHLVSGNYLNGTRYYHSPDSFLYWCASSVKECPRALERFKQTLLDATRGRLDYHQKKLDDSGNDEPWPMDLSMLLLALDSIGELKNAEVARKVKQAAELITKAQNAKDGGWQADSLFKLGRSPTYLGGRSISTIFATAALIKLQQSQQKSNV